MMITPQILSIPPYLSTPWKQISFLFAIPEGVHFKLIVTLQNRMRIVIPNLDKISIETIFEAHAKYGSGQTELPAQEHKVSFPLAGGDGLELLNFVMQHNPNQSNASELPKEALEKIAGIAKVLGLGDVSQFPKPEPHCHCPFCQIARAFHGEPEEASIEEEEPTKEELSFRTWDIKQTSEKLYLVSNPLDDREHYSVYLGESLGCTCGKQNCEHIRAVLNS